MVYASASDAVALLGGTTSGSNCIFFTRFNVPTATVTIKGSYIDIYIAKLFDAATLAAHGTEVNAYATYCLVIDVLNSCKGIAQAEAQDVRLAEFQSSYPSFIETMNGLIADYRARADELLKYLAPRSIMQKSDLKAGTSTLKVGIVMSKLGDCGPNG
jgi:hypothetical protein